VTRNARKSWFIYAVLMLLCNVPVVAQMNCGQCPTIIQIPGDSGIPNTTGLPLILAHGTGGDWGNIFGAKSLAQTAMNGITDMSGKGQAAQAQIVAKNYDVNKALSTGAVVVEIMDPDSVQKLGCPNGTAEVNCPCANASACTQPKMNTDNSGQAIGGLTYVTADCANDSINNCLAKSLPHEFAQSVLAWEPLTLQYACTTSIMCQGGLTPTRPTCCDKQRAGCKGKNCTLLKMPFRRRNAIAKG